MVSASSTSAVENALQRPDVSHASMANAIRFLAVDAVEKAKSGHPGMPMGMADVATVLFTQFLKFDAASPTWADRDRFVLSAGHGSMLLYALLYLTGYQAMPLEELQKFRQLHSKTPGHPEVLQAAGIETTTGPLGQGISNAVGMALAERMLNARFGDSLVNHRTYVIASDGDLMEGISHEACSLAGHLSLSRLIVLWDDNQISIDGPTRLSFTEDVPERFRSYGWDVQVVDGHDPHQIAAALQKTQHAVKPSLIACKTTIGFGAPTKAGTKDSHGSPLGAEEVKGAREKLAWPHLPFVIPNDILNAWRHAGQKGRKSHLEWSQHLAEAPAEIRGAFAHAMSGHTSPALPSLIRDFKRKAVAEKPAVATRVSSGNVLEVLTAAIPEMIGGSADLTPSNNTRMKAMAAVQSRHYQGHYVHFGVREHAMAAAMNGMALHGGIIPYGGTFLTFSDYCRPSIRLAALMKQRVIFIMTHDSIGLGEDGPTHQPIEHLSALRAIPGLRVFRPCDSIETAECWELALSGSPSPSLFALTRQNLPTLRQMDMEDNVCAKGAYVLHDTTGQRQVTLLATGSEVEIAVNAREQLQQKGIAAAVVSMPCWSLFEQQDDTYKASVLGARTGLRVAIEAGVRHGWDRYIGPEGLFVGMSGFGESAPYQDLYKHFGLTAETVVEKVLAAMNGKKIRD